SHRQTSPRVLAAANGSTAAPHAIRAALASGNREQYAQAADGLCLASTPILEPMPRNDPQGDHPQRDDSQTNAGFLRSSSEGIWPVDSGPKDANCGLCHQT